MIKCEICGKEFNNFRSLSDHLRLHKITSKDYYDKYLKKKDEGICPACRKETSYINLNKGYRKFCSKKCACSKENHPMWGKHHSEATKQKISRDHKGKRLSEETKIKISKANKGRIRSEETRKKISKVNKGKIISKETRKKMSEAHKGKIMPEETKIKISEANRGEIISEKTRKKISEGKKGEKNPMFGKRHSEETKKKMSKARIGKHHSEEARRKMSGKNNPNYKDGVSTKKFEEAYGMEPEKWKELAQKVRIRDNFTCQYCGKGNATSVHHIIPRRIKIDNSPDNLITLCRSCHIKIEHLTDKYLAEGKDSIEIFYKEK